MKRGSSFINDIKYADGYTLSIAAVLFMSFLACAGIAVYMAVDASFLGSISHLLMTVILGWLVRWVLKPATTHSHYVMDVTTGNIRKRRCKFFRRKQREVELHSIENRIADMLYPTNYELLNRIRELKETLATCPVHN